MTRLTWLNPGSGVGGLDRAVFYSKRSSAVAWDGLMSVTETTEGWNEQVHYQDGTIYEPRRWDRDYSGIIKAQTFPTSFETDVLRPARAVYFGLSFRISTFGSEKIHLVYNMLLLPLEQDHEPDEAAPFEWTFTSSPILLPDGARTAHIIIDKDIADGGSVAQVEDILYGSATSAPRLPPPREIFDIFGTQATLRVVYNGDGTATIEGPDDVVSMLDATTVNIDWPSVVKLDTYTYEISSY